MSFLEQQFKLKDFTIFTLAILLSVLLWLQLPIFSLVALVAIPVFLAVLVRRLDIRYAVGSLLLVILILSLLTGKPEYVLMLVLQTAPVGIFIGLLFKNGASWGKSLAAVLVLSLLIPAGVFLMEYFITGESPFVLNESVLADYRQGVEEIKETFFAEAVATGDEFDSISRGIEAALPILGMSSTLIWFMLLSAVSFFVARYLIRLMGYKVTESIPFTMWRLPWHAIWGVITGLAMMLGGDQLNSLGMVSIGKVLLIIMGFVYSVLGISVFVFFLRVSRLSRVLKVLGIIILIIFLPNVLVLMAILGIIDSLWNIRRFTQGRKPEEDDLV